MEGRAVGHNIERGPSKDHSTKVWFNLAQWLQRSLLKCEKLTDGRQTLSDTLVVFYSLNATKRVVSLEGDTLVVFYSLNATKKGGLS